MIMLLTHRPENTHKGKQSSYEKDLNMLYWSNNGEYSHVSCRHISISKLAQENKNFIQLYSFKCAVCQTKSSVLQFKCNSTA